MEPDGETIEFLKNLISLLEDRSPLHYMNTSQFSNDLKQRESEMYESCYRNRVRLNPSVLFEISIKNRPIKMLKINYEDIEALSFSLKNFFEGENKIFNVKRNVTFKPVLRENAVIQEGIVRVDDIKLEIKITPAAEILYGSILFNNMIVERVLGQGSFGSVSLEFFFLKKNYNETYYM